ncbi:hypothetical protein ACLB2K_015771 [Fragaria x ananassa]
MSYQKVSPAGALPIGGNDATTRRQKRGDGSLSSLIHICQHPMQEASLTTSYVMLPRKDNQIIPLTSSSSNHLPSTLSLSFLPCFESPIVEATFEDLVLCCATKSYQFYYYICNPLTKQWIALPPVPNVIESKVPVGFICEPCYDHGREEQSSIMKLNAGYRCRVVRILPNTTQKPELDLFNTSQQPELGFFVEIFSSETGEWREYQLPADLTGIGKFGWFIAWRPGVACKGKLYWYNDGDFTLELDPFNISTS